MSRQKHQYSSYLLFHSISCVLFITFTNSLQSLFILRLKHHCFCFPYTFCFPLNSPFQLCFIQLTVIRGSALLKLFCYQTEFVKLIIVFLQLLLHLRNALAKSFNHLYLKKKKNSPMNSLGGFDFNFTRLFLLLVPFITFTNSLQS